jgi:hypothetical protein
MDPFERVNPRAAEMRTRYLLDTIQACGPLAGQQLAADDRRRDAQECAAMWVATHSARQRPPGTWRRRFGTLLVRAGSRLQRIPDPVG